MAKRSWFGSLWPRFLKYGVVGWLLEVVMTGASAVLIERDGHATARTFLWMLPIYGTGGLLCEGASRRLRRWPRPARALAYLPFIYGVEYLSGRALKRLLGACPWDYRRTIEDPEKLVCPEYAPLWFAVALLFEPVRDWAALPMHPPRKAVQRLSARW